MAVSDQKPVYQLASDEKVVPVMVYTATSACWGDLIVKEIIRVSTWLRTNTAPDNISLHNARLLITTSSTPKPVTFPKIHISVSQVWAFHMLPPAKDPPDYDPSEPNRKMEPVTAVVGAFRMDGSLRMATIANLSRYIDVTRELFSGLYDVEISSPVLSGLGTIRVPFTLVRQQTALFANRA